MSEQHETVWTGATWRNYSPAPIAEELPKMNTPRRVDRHRREQTQQQAVLSAVTAEWEKVGVIAARAEVDNRKAWEYLQRGIARGVVERKRGAKSQRTGGAMWVYRLAMRKAA